MKYGFYFFEGEYVNTVMALMAGSALWTYYLLRVEIWEMLSILVNQLIDLFI